ncbi:MAG TPA: hypothetical protein VER12_15865, partial [Polyangiaceae bacterium]|nr:hypothetical protein [Polyangiaceae bacterium]
TRRTSSPPAARQPIGGLRGDFAQWRTLNGLDEQEPFIVVAAEGGGIRAAYWTAAILGGLQDLQPTFAAHLYAVSSVSGGSLGAATFSALLASDENSRYQQRAKQILRHDFLAPPLARMLYTDLVQRFLPFGVSALDRGAALERAWTEAFAEQNLVSFAQPFDSFWAAPHAALPRLFLNST